MKESGMFFYRDWWEAIQQIPKASDRAALYNAIMTYYFTGEEVSLTGEPLRSFTFVKKIISTNAAKKAGGERGGRPKAETYGYENAIKNKTYGYENRDYFKTEDENHLNKQEIKNKKQDIKKESVKEKSAMRFVPPTVEEVRAYCNERGSGVDAERFVDFYASKGWVVGKTKMRDWKAAVRGWDREDKPVKTKTSAPSAEQKVTREDLERMRRFAEQMNGGEEHVKQD